MDPNTYALSLEITLNDLVSEYLSGINGGLDTTVAKVTEVENAFKAMSTNIVSSLDHVSAKMNEVMNQMTTAQEKVKIKTEETNASVAAGAMQNQVTYKNETDDLIGINEQKTDLLKTEKELQKLTKEQIPLKEKSLKSQQDAQNNIIDNQTNINKGERNYHTIAGVTKGIVDKVQGFTKKIGTALLAVATGGASAAAGTAAAGEAAAATGGEMAAAGKAASGMGGGLDKAIDGLFDFANAGYIVYGTVLVMLANWLDEAAARAEKFKTAMYRATGSMNEIMIRASMMTSGLKATSDEVDEVISALIRAGANKKNVWELTEATTIFSKALGVSADVAAQFANRMRVVLGTTRLAEASMAMLYKAAEHFSLSGEDMTNIMTEATESATLLGTYGEKAVSNYTETLVAAAAAAKNLGVNTSKATQLIASMKEPLAGVKILGGAVLQMDPAKKMEEILKRIPNIEKQYEEMVKARGAGYATMYIKARYDIDPEQLKILKEMTKTKEVMLKVGITTEQAEKDMERIKNAAQESMTGVYTEMLKIMDNIKNIGMMIVGPLLPLLKIIFMVVNGIFSIIAGFVAPISEMLMKMWSLFDVSNELGEMFTILRNIALAIGKVLGFIIFVLLAPFIAGVVLLVKGFSVLWEIIQPIASAIADIFGFLAGGIWDALMALIDGFNGIFKTLKEGIRSVVSGMKSLVTLGGTFDIATVKEVAKYIGAATAAVLALVVAMKAAAIAEGAWNIVRGAGNKLLGEESLLMKAKTVWTNLMTKGNLTSTKGIWDKVKGIFSLTKAEQGLKAVQVPGKGLILEEASAITDAAKANKGLIGTIWQKITALRSLSLSQMASNVATRAGTLFSSLSSLSLGGAATRIGGLFTTLKTAIPSMLSFGKLAGFASSAVSGLGSAMSVLGPVALMVGAAIGGWKIGKWIGEITGLHKSTKELADEHRKALKNSPEIKAHMSEIDKLAEKRIANLDTEGKLRAKNLKLWGLNNTQASIGAKSAQDELKMLESMAKAGNKNADMLKRLNELRKAAKEAPQAKVVPGAGGDWEDMAKRNRAFLEGGPKAYSRDEAPLINEVPTVKVQEGGPKTPSPVTDLIKVQSENSEKMKSAVDYLKEICKSSEEAQDLLKVYLPKLVEGTTDTGLASVANNWI